MHFCDIHKDFIFVFQLKLNRDGHNQGYIAFRDEAGTIFVNFISKQIRLMWFYMISYWDKNGSFV